MRFVIYTIIVALASYGACKLFEAGKIRGYGICVSEEDDDRVRIRPF